jgi:hypothetical protein
MIGALAGNFLPMLELKWYIDYFKITDKLCNKISKSKLEIESLRYNIYNFLTSDDQYKKLEKEYTTSYYALIVTITLIFIIFIILVCLSYISEDSKFYDYFKNSYILAFFVGSNDTSIGSILMTLTILYAIFYIIITTVNTIVLDNFKNINAYIVDPNTDLCKYYLTYKILNAIIIISNLENKVFEYNYDKLNEKEDTLDIILEKNVSSYTNLTNGADIKNIKMQAYRDLDFLKYLVFDRTSVYYLKYFNNPYIQMPTKITNQYDVTENVYLKDLYNKDNNKSAETVNELYGKLKQAISISKLSMKEGTVEAECNNSDNKDANLISICDFVKNDTKVPIRDFRYALKTLILKDDFDNNIKPILDEIESYQGEYDVVNELIYDKLKGSVHIDVPDKDYIKYYLQYQDVLFDNTKTKDIIDKLDYQGNFVFAYIFYWIVLFFIISHCLYIYIASPIYTYMMLCILIAYLCVVWIHIQYTFINTS